MNGFINNIIAEISSAHFNIMFLLGCALFFGTIGGELFEKFKFPKVIGYILIGIILGQNGIKLIDKNTLELMEPLSYFALGVIGFLIGCELKKELFIKRGKQYLIILLIQSLGTFLLVSSLLAITGLFLGIKSTITIPLSLLLGAIASSTAPAATMSVLRENKSRGPLTKTIIVLVALDDGLALILFSIALAISTSYISHTREILILAKPFYEIFGAAIIGSLSGLLLHNITQKFHHMENLLAFLSGLVMLVIGLSIIIKTDMLLSSMFMGIIYVNLSPNKSEELVGFINKFMDPIYILFFALFGAKLIIPKLSIMIIALITVFTLSRIIGKSLGAYLGALVAKSPDTVKNYLPYALLDQAGIAIGLTLVLSHKFNIELVNTISIIIMTSLFVIQIITPIMLKWAIIKSGEAGLNITEEDIIEHTKVKHVMETNIPIIREDMSVKDIIEIFSKSALMYFPVVSYEKKLSGIITIDSIKKIINYNKKKNHLIAYKLIEPIKVYVNPETPLTEVVSIFKRLNLEYLPVTDNNERLIGFIEKKAMDKLISDKIIEFHHRKEE